MAVDITALYCCLDDFCKVFADWEAHRLLPSQQTRQRSGKLSRAEMLFIVVLFHLSPYKNFKVFYLYGIGGQYCACFDELPHYDRFVSPMRSEEHTSELPSRQYLVCLLLLEKKQLH